MARLVCYHCLLVEQECATLLLLLRRHYGLAPIPGTVQNVGEIKPRRLEAERDKLRAALAKITQQ